MHRTARKLYKFFRKGLGRYKYIILAALILTDIFLLLCINSSSWRSRGLISPNHFKHLYMANPAFAGVDTAYIIIERKENAVLIPSGENGSFSIDIKDDALFNPDTLLKIWQINRDLLKSAGIDKKRTASFFTTGDNQLQINILPQVKEEIDVFKEIILADPRAYGRFLSKNMMAGVIEVNFIQGVSASDAYNILNSVRQRNLDGLHNIYIAGLAVLRGWLNVYLRITGLLFMATALTVSLVFYIVFKPRN